MCSQCLSEIFCIACWASGRTVFHAGTQEEANNRAFFTNDEGVRMFCFVVQGAVLMRLRPLRGAWWRWRLAWRSTGRGERREAGFSGTPVPWS